MTIRVRGRTQVRPFHRCTNRLSCLFYIRRRIVSLSRLRTGIPDGDSDILYPQLVHDRTAKIMHNG